MKRIKKKLSGLPLFLVFYLLILFSIFYPVFLQGKIPISANLLVSFYNPWQKETLPGWEGGVPNKPTGIDDLRIYIPQRNFTNLNFLEGKIPFWNPYVFSGNYHVGQSELAVFYPLFLLSLVSPMYLGWTILIIIEPLLTGLGMFLFLRLLFRNFGPAFFGSIVFALSGIVLVRMVDGLSVGHTLIWIPFIFYGIEGYLQKYKIRYLYVILIALSLSLLAGWFQFTFYSFVLGLLYALFSLWILRSERSIKLWKKWLVVLPFVLLPIITSFHVLSALQAFSDSPRGIQVEKVLLDLHLMPLQHLLTYIFPDFWGNPGSYNFFGRSEYKESILYIGLIPLVFSLFSLFGRIDKRIKFFSIAALVSLILGIDNPLTRSILNLPIPIVQSFLPDRIFFVTTFCLSILAAFGINQLLLGKIKAKTVILVFKILGAILLLVDIYLLSGLTVNHLVKLESPGTLSFVNTFQSELYKFGMIRTEKDFMVQVKNTILGNLTFIFLIILFLIRKNLRPKTFFSIIIFATVIFQVYFAWKYIPFSSPQFFFPSNPVFSYLKQNSGISRFASVGDASISPNIPLYYGLYSADGVGAMYPENYAQLVRYAQSRGEDTRNVSRVEVNPVISSKKLFTQQDPYTLRFMQLAGVKYIVKLRNEDPQQPERFTTNGTDKFKLIWENSKWQIFENKNALPRFFWTGSYIASDNKEEVLKNIFDEKFNPQTIVLEKYPGFNTNKNSSGEIKLLDYSPNEVIFQSSSSTNGLLFLSDNYTKNFKVKIDGKENNIIKADYSFRAVPLPAGNHIIRMYYDSSIVIFGLLIGGSLFFLSLILSFVVNRKKILSL